VRRVVGLALIALMLTTATAALAHPEGAHLLDAPPTEGAHLLELGAGLDSPTASADATRIRPTAAPPPPPAESAGRGGLRQLAAATPTRPADLAIFVRGGMSAMVRSTLASDLAYVRAVRVDDGGSYIVEGNMSRVTGRVTARLTLRGLDGNATLMRNYDGPEAGVLTFLHRFADDVVEALTGARAAFDSRIAFSRRIARGRKDILVAAADGRSVERVSSGHGIATLPAFGPDRVFYSVATPTGVFITASGLGEHPIVGGFRTNMGARYCAGRLYFASSREGNTDIYSVALDGTDERRLTAHAAIDVSPTCDPEGGIAFVSDRRGRPQIFLARQGLSEPEQLTRTEIESQTPALCGPWLAYTEVQDGMRIMLLDRRDGTVRRVSPRIGNEHKDPAFSPDCRMLAWASPRGVMIARRDGRLPRLVIAGQAEAVRWAR